MHISYIYTDLCNIIYNLECTIIDPRLVNIVEKIKKYYESNLYLKFKSNENTAIMGFRI